jgi:hypothetical protein
MDAATATEMPIAAPRRVTTVGDRQRMDVTQSVLTSMLRSEAIGREIVFSGVADPRVPRPQGSDPELRRRLNQSLRDAHRHTIADLQRERRCGLCHRRYRERANIGQWECARHTGEITVSWGLQSTMPSYLQSTMLYVWSCCGKNSWGRGCTPCDHSEATVSGTVCSVASVPRFLQLPTRDAIVDGRDLALDDGEIERCIARPLTDAVVSTVHDGWLHPDIRDPRDVRGAEEERYYQEHLAGPAQPPLLVMRVDHWNLRPKIAELY